MTNLPQNAWRRPLFDFPRSIDELFDVFDGRSSREAAARGWSPAADVVETAEGFEVTLELPGVDADGVEVTLDKRTLRIAGDKAGRELAEGAKAHLTEVVRGAFERRFTFAVPVDEEGVSAHFDAGVLTVTVKKAQPEQPRRIEIQRG